MRTCPRCGRENGEDVRFCGRCGLDLNLYAAKPGAVTEAAPAYCFRHPKAATNLSCGRCERPVCTKCAINGPAGIRCRDCAKHTVPMRPGAIVYEAKRSIFSFGQMGRYSPVFILVLLSLLLGTTRGCLNRSHDEDEASEAPARSQRGRSESN